MLKALLAAAVLVSLAAAAPASAAQPILPLEEVRPGMRCTGLTVLEGTEISSFDVAILDVIAGDPIDDQPLLLVRVSGPAVAPIGIASGFSGAPVVCDGRIAGAIAYGSGDFGNEVGFATPIESLLDEPAVPSAGARRAPALRARAERLLAPLAISGVAPAVHEAFAGPAAEAGIALRTVPPAPADDRFPPQELRPGASLGIGLASGDVSVGAVGTVTYVDGASVWGLGHSFEAAGRRSLLLQDAWVYTVIDNPLGIDGAVSSKLAAPGHVLGTITNDTRSGVTGVVGEAPPTVPLRITTRDRDTGARRELTAEVADETGVGLPSGLSPVTLVAPIALAQAAYTALDGSPAEQSARMCVRIGMRQLRRPARFCNRYVGSYGYAEDGPPGGPFVADLSDALLAIDEYRYGTPRLTGVEIELDLWRGRRQAFLRSIRGPRVLRRGETATLLLGLERYRGERYRRCVRLRVPDDAPLGRRRVTLVGTPADGDAGDEEAIVIEIGGGGGGRPAAGAPESFARSRGRSRASRGATASRRASAARGAGGRC